MRQYLPHQDRERGKAEADVLAAAFRTQPTRRAATITLQQLFDIYLREVTPSKAAGTQHHDRTAAALLLRTWGRQRPPLTLGLRDWQQFIADRRSGRLAPERPKGVRRKRKGVGNRQIAYDLKFAVAVFNWATMAGDGEGGVLLERNPCKGFPLPNEARPQRPRMPEHRYRRLLAVAPDVHLDFHLALVLCHETGHRLASVRQLWWSDMLWDRQLVRWRGETDKEGNHHLTPLTEAAVTALLEMRARTRAIGDTWIFLNANGDGPRERCRFRAWWLRAEGLAKLEHDERWGWHSLRRKFATELKDIPLKDLCDLGGWKSPQTILACYQESDEDTMRRALANRRPVGAMVTRMESRNGEQSLMGPLQDAPQATVVTSGAITS
ncbi:MAG: tyrosine-type recombinase/integrase [Gemmatimonadota bacterium]